jgi:DnaJ-class molecular chaperone
MPKGPSEKDGFGELAIHFNIEFPESLTNQQKQIIQSAFK